MVEVNLEMIQTLVARVLSNQETHDRRFDNIDGRLLAVEKGIINTRHEILSADEVMLQKQDQLDYLRHRITALEREVTELKAKA